MNITLSQAPAEGTVSALTLTLKGTAAATTVRVQQQGQQKAKSAVLLSIQSDIGKGIIYNIRLSRWYLAYCFLMAIATLCLVVFMIVDVHFRKNPVPVWVCAVDGLITFAVCFETIADMILLGMPFWSSGWHVFDFAVSLVCFVSWLLLLLEVDLCCGEQVGVVESLDEFVTVILLTIRYVAQFVRIVRYIRTGAEAQDSLSTAEKHIIRFDTPGGREDPGLSSAVPGGELDF
ncbi:hypothetical protein, conserved [Eimeria praecox]|uniref:Ion transport domain-containing protein n=1 Tax=Eimeria praecox TaxID=51316 RepID=U6G8M8_9EIME|nr:hypothetical protein, conserved [Eimeria praecox]